jgi:hypothetical protein
LAPTIQLFLLNSIAIRMRTTASSPAVGVVAARRASIGLSYGLVVGFQHRMVHHRAGPKTPVPDCIASPNPLAGNPVLQHTETTDAACQRSARKDFAFPDRHTLILIDFQSQMAFATKSIAPVALRNNAGLIANAARIFNVLTIPTTIAEQTFSGPMFDEIKRPFQMRNILTVRV